MESLEFIIKQPIAMFALLSFVVRPFGFTPLSFVGFAVAAVLAGRLKIAQVAVLL
jgi:hypothetical protein